MKRIEMLANYVVGAIGVIGQAEWLYHSLTSYPFKILSSPPSRFYASTGLVLAFVSPALSLLALKYFTEHPHLS